ncbi:MAG: ATP-binding protein, partial [Anaerolineales bacterium]
ALAALYAACNAPLFGVYEEELGHGIVGGRLVSMQAWGQRAAETALRILHGEPPGHIKCPPTSPGAPVYDWRELQRWHIRKDRLPPGSEVRFRQPTNWEQHKWQIAGILLITLVETALIILLAINLTRRRRAERLLRESEYRLRLAAQAAGAGLWSLNLATNTLWLTNQARKLFVLPEGEPVTLERFLDLVHPQDRKSIRQRLKEVVESRGDISDTFRIVRPDGTIVWIASRSSVQCDPSGQPQSLTGVSTDVTEQRRNTEEMQRLQVEAWHADRVVRTGAITSSLAHELNQPLAATLSAAQAGLRFLAAERHDPNDIRAILESIVQDTKRAGSVVSGLRAMLRRQPSQRERLDLANVARDMGGLLHSELLTHHVHLALQFPRDCHIVADKTQIQQVILNLIMNAIEAMQQLPDAERRIEIAAAHRGADTVQVSVTDSGPGIPEDKAARLFDAFWTTKPQGLGIGLAICRSIVESHGGRIWLAHSQPGKTTFCFSLPLDAAS